MASHHVLIFGDLKGEVFAGSPKDKADPGFAQAFIYVAGSFEPTVVAIAGNYQTADDMDRNLKLHQVLGQAEALMIALQDQTLVYRPVSDFFK